MDLSDRGSGWPDFMGPIDCVMEASFSSQVKRHPVLIVTDSPLANMILNAVENKWTYSALLGGRDYSSACTRLQSTHLCYSVRISEWMSTTSSRYATVPVRSGFKQNNVNWVESHESRLKSNRKTDLKVELETSVSKWNRSRSLGTKNLESNRYFDTDE